MLLRTLLLYHGQLEPIPSSCRRGVHNIATSDDEDVQNEVLPTASRQGNLEGDLLVNARFLADVVARQTQLLEKQKSMMEELRLLGASRPTSTVEGETKSVFVVGYFDGQSTGAIFEVKIKPGSEISTNDTPLILPVIKFPIASNKLYSARIFNRSELYLMPEGLGSTTSDTRYVFNTAAWSLVQSLPPTIAPKGYGIFVSAYGELYFLSNKSPPMDPCFERYDPDRDVWEPMPPVPYSEYVTGYAVCYGVILFVTWSGALAFHVGRREWHEVKVKAKDSKSNPIKFQGRAVVVGNNIYALTGYEEEEITAFSLSIDEDDEGGGGAYLLTKLFTLDLNIAQPPFFLSRSRRSEYLVHLGELDFFHVVARANKEIHNLQHMCFTTFRIVVGERGKHKIKTLHSTYRFLDLEGPYHRFSVSFGFMREHRDSEPEEERIGLA